MRTAVSGILFGVLVLGSGRSAAAHDGLHEQIVAVTRELERTPKSPVLHLRRAELFRLHRQWDAALSDLERAEELDPALDGVILCRARLCVDAGRLDAAGKLLELHLARHPEDPGALLLRAQLARRCGDAEGAVRDYDRAIAALDPPEPDHVLERAELLVSLGPGGVDRALAGIDAALVRLGSVTALELRAIELEELRGRFDDALARLDGIAARSPRQERWLSQRGEILLGAGRPAEALAAFGAARTALEDLPLRHRSSAAIRALECELDCRLAELGVRLGTVSSRS